MVLSKWIFANSDFTSKLPRKEGSLNYTKLNKIYGDWLKIILRLEDKINTLLRTIKNKLPDSSCDCSLVSWSSSGVLYGLIKVHKQNCSTRPILSVTGTFNYICAMCLVPVLNPLTYNGYDFTVKNSTEFTR